MNLISQRSFFASWVLFVGLTGCMENADDVAAPVEGSAAELTGSGTGSGTGRDVPPPPVNIRTIPCPLEPTTTRQQHEHRTGQGPLRGESFTLDQSVQDRGGGRGSSSKSISFSNFEYSCTARANSATTTTPIIQSAGGHPFRCGYENGAALPLDWWILRPNGVFYNDVSTPTATWEADGTYTRVVRNDDRYALPVVAVVTVIDGEGDGPVLLRSEQPFTVAPNSCARVSVTASQYGSSFIATHGDGVFVDLAIGPGTFGSCQIDSDCNDSNVCTDDVCRYGRCYRENNTHSCDDDGNACTRDVCQAGACRHPAEPAGVACDDGNACTTDVCDGAGACTGKVSCGLLQCSEYRASLDELRGIAGTVSGPITTWNTGTIRGVAGIMERTEEQLYTFNVGAFLIDEIADYIQGLCAGALGGPAGEAAGMTVKMKKTASVVMEVFDWYTRGTRIVSGEYFEPAGTAEYVSSDCTCLQQIDYRAAQYQLTAGRSTIPCAEGNACSEFPDYEITRVEGATVGSTLALPDVSRGDAQTSTTISCDSLRCRTSLEGRFMERPRASDVVAEIGSMCQAWCNSMSGSYRLSGQRD